MKGVTCCILCPSKRVASADLMVKMDSAQLVAVCEYIKEGYTRGESLQPGLAKPVANSRRLPSQKMMSEAQTCLKVAKLLGLAAVMLKLWCLLL